MIVFLDIDGVLNSPRNYQEWCLAREADPNGIKSLMPHFEDPHVLKLFDPVNVECLNKITDATNAQIVISSSWRFWFADRQDELKQILGLAGVKAEILGVTPTLQRDRANAIEEWLSRRADGSGRVQQRIAILDDEPPGNFRRLRSWLVRTDGACGLVPGDVDKALRILHGKPWTRGRAARVTP